MQQNNSSPAGDEVRAVNQKEIREKSDSRCEARVVAHVLGSEGLEHEVRGKGRDVDDSHARELGIHARRGVYESSVFEPLDGEREVAFADGTEDRVSLSLMQGSREEEGIDHRPHDDRQEERRGRRLGVG